MLESEDKIQAQCFTWLWNTYPKIRRLCFHIPNGGNRSAREGNKFTAMGVIPGIPDLSLAVSSMQGPIRYGCLFIEMKTPKGKPSEEQIRTHEALSAAGNRVVFCRSLIEFKEIVNNWLKGSDFCYL